VALTLKAYFGAINEKRWRSVWLQYTPRLRQQVGIAHLASADDTSHDFDLVIHWARRLDSTTAQAFVTFASTQAASDGPNGDTRDYWTLNYTFRHIGGRWLIDGAKAHGGSAYTAG
jgi:hypothetical protein